MPRARFNKLPKERREQILDVAAKEFATHGFERASLNHVLGAAGLSKGAAYYYFDDKADLFAAVLERFFTRYVLQPKPDATGSADAFWDWVIALYRQSMQEFRDTPWMLGLAKAAWKLPRKAWLDGRLGEVFARVIDWMKELMHNAQRVGAVRTDLPDEVLIELIMAVDEVGDRWVAEHWRAGENDEEVIAMTMRIWDGMRLMLAPQPASASSSAPSPETPAQPIADPQQRPEPESQRPATGKRSSPPRNKEKSA